MSPIGDGGGIGRPHLLWLCALVGSSFTPCKGSPVKLPSIFIDFILLPVFFAFSQIRLTLLSLNHLEM